MRTTAQLQMVPAWVLVVALISAPAVAVADVVITRDTVQKYVNIRSAPNANAEAIGKLHRGDQVTFVETIPRWHEVTLADGRKGFISRVWTQVVATPAVVRKVVPEPAVAENGVAQAPDNPDMTNDTKPTPSPSADERTASVPDEVDKVVPQAPPETPKVRHQEPVVSEPVVVATPVPADPQPTETPVAEEPSELPVFADIEGTPNYLSKFTGPNKAGDSRIIDDGTNVGIGTALPQQALDVNGNVQIHNQSSNLVVLSLKQQAGQTGYITHNIAGTLTIGAGSEDRITVDRDGNVGIGTNRPRHQLEMANGAHVTAGGVWTNASSRDLKENIAELALEEALVTLRNLTAVQFNYKLDINDSHVGFIAEDVPELVATADRRGLSSMDIVAVLTKVVQAQQLRLDELEARLGKE